MAKTETKTLTACAEFFRKNQQFSNAKEVYLKLGDTRSLMKLYVDFDKWDDAFMLLKSHPECKVCPSSAFPLPLPSGKKPPPFFSTVDVIQEDVYLPYARWLVLQDRFDEAQVRKRKKDDSPGQCSYPLP